MIEFKNISKTYKMGEVDVHALKDISFTIEDGEFIAVMGPSGSGKSTLMNVIGCLDVPTGGRFFLNGIDVAELPDSRLAEIRNEEIGFIFQNFNLLPRMTALSNVELPLIYAGDQRDRQRRAASALETVSLKDRALHRPRELSGGEQQRAAIARSLINNPSLILADEPTGNLDSSTGREILSILSDLNRKGITIVLVTHEEFIASYARRVIRMQDGRIVEDKRSGAAQEQDSHSSAAVEKDPLVSHSRAKRRFSFAELRESLYMAVSSIVSNKLRSSLTMLGIIVGVGCVIAMISLGQGASSQITERISKMGANLLMVRPGAARRGHARMARGSRRSLTSEDARAILEECPSVARVDPSYSSSSQVVYGNKNTNTPVSGTTPSFPEVRNFPVQTGSFFTERDNRMMSRKAVLGKTVVSELFDEEDPIGQYIKIRRVNFEVIGIMSEKGSSGWRDEDDIIFVPLRTAQKRLFGVDHVSMINVEAKSEDLMDRATTEITELLRERHRIRDQAPDDFNTRSQAEIMSMVQETSKTFTMLLASIAAVSLLVGGIGIMNIMLVSVTERTREVGIRKAIGGQRRDILSQFLIEAVVLSMSGGLVGIGVGVLISRLTSKLAGWPTVLSPMSILLSFSFAVAVGLFFGFYPARKAALLNPIDALRWE
jgi:macrolide transport system ATP-binding/permease protein